MAEDRHEDKHDVGNQPALRQALVEMSGDDELLFADGFDNCILGLVYRCSQPHLVAYDYAKAVETLADTFTPSEGQTREDVVEEAEEFLQFNTLGAWVGERTPVWLVIQPPPKEPTPKDEV